MRQANVLTATRGVPQALPVRDAEESGGLAGFGVFCLAMFLFLGHSRAADIVISGLRLPLITSVLAFGAMLAIGGLPQAATPRIGIFVSLFSGWLFLIVPFSSWPGGSVQTLIDQWIRSFFLFFIVAGLPRSMRHCRIAMYGLALADVAILLMSLIYGTTEIDGRFSLQEGVLANPNDLAQLLLIGLPFLFLAAITRDRFPLQRPLATIAIVAVLVRVLQTGSRGGILTLLVVAATMLLKYSWLNRLKMIVAVVLVAFAILPFVSEQQRIRYLTLFSDEAPDSNSQDKAYGSSEERQHLLWQSIALTLANPVFGVGPGTFNSASAAYSEQLGERAIWHETHNTYTQVSSETGLPGFAMFMAIIVMSLRVSISSYKAARNNQALAYQAETAYCLGLATTCFAVSAFFTSSAYLMFMPTLAGLAVALKRNSRVGADVPADVPAARRFPGDRSPLPGSFNRPSTRAIHPILK